MLTMAGRGLSFYGVTGSNADGRAYKVSHNWLLPAMRATALAHFRWSARLCFWRGICRYPRRLEANGFDVCSDTLPCHTDRSIGWQSFSVARFSYRLDMTDIWSGNQRANVEAARAAGVHSAFLSGNEVSWNAPSRQASTDSSATAYRTLVCYKETKDNTPIHPADPPTWTGSWRSPRFSPPADGGQPRERVDRPVLDG